MSIYIYACLQYIERIASPDDTTLESLPICIYSTTYLFTYFYVPVYPCNNIRKKKITKMFLPYTVAGFSFSYNVAGIR